ncbi:FG-GAP-like repeat-containing protein [Streptomyces sp. NPDC096095]|uniref:FG-GAP-like repeat-containing protein n=1 Tax=Streptomyces sp. NPDC096095 TaxID=3155545 RepID=UPI0033222607
MAALAALLVLGVPHYQPEAAAAEPESATTPEVPKDDATATAAAKASETGRPTEVLAQRTEISQLFANPDGSLTQDTYALPKFVRKDGRLVAFDTTLETHADGTLSPRATEIDVRFSGGGEGALATVERDGRSMSWTWPQPLPEPDVDGDTVTYGNVLTDVDLKLKASPAGFTSLLVVKTAAAAADPALKQVQFGLDTQGLKARTDAHGNFTAVNPAGEEVFTAPTPLMWDSSSAAAPAALSSRSAAAEPPPPADAFEPGYGAQQATMGLSVADGKLSLTPDQELLTGADTQYPVLLDPAVSGSRHSWAIAYKKHPNSSFFNGANWDTAKGTTTARVGYENETNGLARSFFRMNASNLWSTKKVVSSSTFRIKNTWSWSCTNRTVELWATSAISSSTTWNKQPSWRKKLDSVNDSRGYASSCPAGNLAFDVTAAAKDGIANRWNTLTFGMQASSEGDVYGWKKFDANSAVLSTTYNTVPNAPNSLDTIPSSGGCDTVAPYTTIGNTDVTLTAKVSDADGGTVRAQFRMWRTNSLAGGTEIFNQIVSATSGTVAKVKVPKATLQQHLAAANGHFGWKVQTLDSTSKSAWTPSGICGFTFDPTRPSTPPTISSQQFPDGTDGWPATTGEARTAGTFVLGSGGVDDVQAYEYWTDWDLTVRKVTPGTDLDGDGKADAKVVLTPPAAGSQRLFVRSLDAAQNRSDRAAYLFYADGLSVPDKPADLNGDGLADLYGVRGGNELWLYAGQGNGRVGTGTIASNSDFAQAGITHRGDWTGDGYEDLVATIPGDEGKTLQLYPNNGVGWACTARDEQADGHSRSCLYDRQELTVFDEANNHWSDADQILAVGDVDGPLDTDGDGTVDVAGYPDLLVKEGDLLWLYFGSPSLYLDDARAPVLVGNGSWSYYDLAAPGDRTGNGHVDVIARHRTSGELRLYEGTGPEGQGLGDGTASTVIGSGWTRSHRPLITAVPDANSDNNVDIFATGGDDKFYLYPNISGSGIAVGSSGWLDFQALS